MNILFIILMITSLIYVILLSLFYLTNSISERLSQKKNYRITTNGTAFAVERRYLPSAIPGKLTWEKSTSSFRFDTIEEAENYIGRMMNCYLEDVVNNAKKKTVVKEY